MTRAPWTTRIGRAVTALALLAGALATAPLLTAAAQASTLAPASTVSAASASVPPSSSPGYWLAAANGAVYSFGTTNYGSVRSSGLAAPIVAGAATNDGLGYWLASTDGGVFAFGDAPFLGSLGNVRLNRPIVGMAADPVTGGYWMVASDGGVFSFRAPFYGSTGGIRLNQPVVGMTPTPDGRGYWLVARDGGIFAFGDAKFFGSTGNIHLNRPVVGMAADQATGGYWLVASDGGIFAYHAPFYGSTGNVALAQPVDAMAAPQAGDGYWLVARDGGIFNYGRAPFLGSTGAHPGSAPIVTMMATSHGYPFPPGGIGYDVSQFSCGHLPAARSFAIVQVTNGAINSSGANPCYPEEAAWAGPNMSAYIFMDGLPSPPPPESKSGPAGTCNGNVACESYNFGWFWAHHWVLYSQSAGFTPPMWWLDVEGPNGAVPWSSNLSNNARVVQGALAAVRATAGVQVGVYSTSFQWPQVVGSLSLPGIPLWAAGADNETGDSFSATSFCTASSQRFADGVMTLVQYGWLPGGQPSPFTDPDYACR